VLAVGTALAEPLASRAPAQVTSPLVRARLDLSIGDIRRYVDAAELDTPPARELEEIIVNGRRPEPLPEHREIPRGLSSALYYAATHPLDSWRILVPDPNLQIPDRTVDDPKEAPGAFRARILEPGRIYD
jgi:hypothetical protein